MSKFRPTRASPPSPNFADSVARTVVSDVSRTSAVSVPELIGLTPEDVALLDDVIARAAPSATTFLTVFKAYNDILQERGLDPHEVVYYGKLLKLGTVKGKNWGEKWSMVKLQYGYGGSYGGVNAKYLDLPKKTTALPLPGAFARLNTHLKTRYDEDALTLHSDQDDTEMTQSNLDTDAGIDVPQYHLTPRPIPRRSLSPAPSTTTTTMLDIDNMSTSSHPLVSVARPGCSVPPLPTRPRTSLPVLEAIDDNTGTPSHRAAIRDHHRPMPQVLPLPQSHYKMDRPFLPLGITPSAAARQAIALARERRGSVINDGEAWNKIKMVRDEKEADRFREDRVIERCWDVWKEGFRWIIRTNKQIDQARDTLLLRLSLQRWRGLTASRQELHQRVTALANNRHLRSVFGAWKSKLKGKRLTKWRHDMRTRLKTVRETREGKLRKDAWAKWRQSYRSHLSGQRYTERLVLRFFQRWKSKWYEVDHLDAVGDEFLHVIKQKAAERCWHYWKKAMEIRKAERATREMVGLRVMGEVIDIWKKRTRDSRAAVTYYRYVVMKSTIRSWKTARDRIRVMENRAVKHVSRKNDVLLRAVSRVWKARERGRLLERVRTVRLVKDVWAVWQRRIKQQKQLEDFALAFSLRSNSYVVSAALQIWRQIHTTHQNAYRFAVQYNAAQVLHEMVLVWRIRLRSKFKLVKQARLAEKYFVVRRTWALWISKLDKKRQERKLQDFEKRRQKICFTTWLQRTRKARQRRSAETTIRDRITMRMLHTVLTRWTNRVIGLKLRELEVAQRNENNTLIFAFKKWKGVCSRHFEELSLMESYQFVKREEDIRRMFHHWLSASRTSRHRRITLQQKEDEINHAHIAVAWDRWRDRFTDEKLRSIEHSATVQAQNSLLFRSFGMWQSKTKSLPAIRFHACHTRVRAWQIWRQAMPRAFQAKDAREMDKKGVLTKTFDRWVQAYRTKMALKAVARARYLRLPTTAPRTVVARRRAPTPVVRTVPRKAIDESSKGADVEARPSRSPPPSRPFIGRTDITSLMSRRPRSEASPPRPTLASRKTRESSPPYSKSPFGGARSARNTSPTRASRPPSSMSEVGKSTLWLELRELQRKSGPPTEASQRSREPP